MALIVWLVILPNLSSVGLICWRKLTCLDDLDVCLLMPILTNAARPISPNERFNGTIALGQINLINPDLHKV